MLQNILEIVDYFGIQSKIPQIINTRNTSSLSMHMRAKTELPAILSLLLFVVSSVAMLAASNTVLATPANWSEVARFTGGGAYQWINTTDFIIGHVDWRIRWSYVPDATFPDSAVLGVLIYLRAPNTPLIDYFGPMTVPDTSGTEYFHTDPGTFFLTVSMAFTESYTLIVEQDLDSIPEFPSFLIVPIFMITTLLTVIAYRRKHYM